MKLLIPLILLLLGLGGGVGAGLVLRPAADTAAVPPASKASDPPPAVPAPRGAQGAESDNGEMEYIKLNNQFVIPIVTSDSVESLVVMSLSLEVAAGESETVYLREPKLRDEFLQVMFDHANMGGFRGTFTDTGKLASLRAGLFEVAHKILGPVVSGVLITDMTRQDV